MPMKPHLDYATSYDTGTDAVTAIQPVINGEAATQNVFRRPSENLRGRSESLRRAIDDLFYFRDRPAYVMQMAGAGVLAWDGTILSGGTGVLDNTTQLTVSPLGGAVANTKGAIGIGTAASNRVNYTVTAGTYASDGVNRWLIEHRHVAAQATVQVNIGPGPNHLILVTFDTANIAHDAIAIASAVNTAISGNAETTGKLLATSAGVASTACISSGGPLSFFDGVISATLSGTPTVDQEAHTLPAGALGTLTTATPLVEGAVILIAYRDIIEPEGGDPDDPKVGLPGGRSESNPARSNTAVTANLVILSGAPTDGLHLSGAIPLLRIVNGAARFIDSTSISAGNAAPPGAGIGAEISTAGFHGPTTLEVNGGILTSDTTLTAALVTIDARLAQRRIETWTATDGSNSIGGDFNAPSALVSAIAACDPGAGQTGGTIHARRGSYTSPAVGSHNLNGITIEGEAGISRPVWTFNVAGVTLTGVITLKGMRLVRALGVNVTVTGSLCLIDCVVDTGLFSVDAADANSFVELIDTDMVPTSQNAVPGYGMAAFVPTLRVRGGRFEGPDTLVPGIGVSRPSIFSTLNTTSIDISGALAIPGAQAGWRPVSTGGSPSDTLPPRSRIAWVGQGVYDSTGAALGSMADLSTSARVEVSVGAQIVDVPEPTRVVFHPVRERDFNNEPIFDSTPSTQTPELELVEIRDPRTAGVVAGFVALPATVLLSDVDLGGGDHHWRLTFGANAFGTLAQMSRGDVVSLENVGYFRVHAVNRQTGNGSLVVTRLDGGRFDMFPGAFPVEMHYYRVVRGHTGGSADAGVQGTMLFDPSDPQMSFLPVAASAKPTHQLLGGLIVGADVSGAGGLVVGRRRGAGIATPTGDAPNFTPDFIVDSTSGTTYVRAVSGGAAILDSLELGAVPSVEAALTALAGTDATYNTRILALEGLVGNEWDYAVPQSRTLCPALTGGAQASGSWLMGGDAGGGINAICTGIHVTAPRGRAYEYIVPVTLPVGAIVTEMRFQSKAGASRAGAARMAVSWMRFNTFTFLDENLATVYGRADTAAGTETTGAISIAYTESAPHYLRLQSGNTAGTDQFVNVEITYTVPGPR